MKNNIKLGVFAFLSILLMIAASLRIVRIIH